MKGRNFVWLTMIALILQGCAPARVLLYNFSDVRDYKKFPYREIHTSSSGTFSFRQASEEFKGLHPWKATFGTDSKQELSDYLSQTKTAAFLIIRNDSILFEQYYHKYDEASIVPSFSVAKSIVSILIGIAIEEGAIQSVEDPVTRYVPELKENGFDAVKLKHVLQMTTGIRSGENYYNPFSGVAKLYYGRQLEKDILKLKLETTPGTAYEYMSANTQLLGLILTRATGKTLSEYLEEKIWQPVGMEYDATWSLDKKGGMEKAFCCLNMRARDYARIGRLYLRRGNWEGRQIVPEEWVRESTRRDASEGAATYYQYQWWLPTKGGDYMAQGHLGQYIYVYPKKNVVMIRLGKKGAGVSWSQVFVELTTQL